MKPRHAGQRQGAKFPSHYKIILWALWGSYGRRRRHKPHRQSIRLLLLHNAEKDAELSQRDGVLLPVLVLHNAIGNLLDQLVIVQYPHQLAHDKILDPFLCHRLFATAPRLFPRCAGVIGVCFAGGDVHDEEYRIALVDTFLNSVYLYDDDHLVLVMNYSGEHCKVGRQHVAECLLVFFLSNLQSMKPGVVLLPVLVIRKSAGNQRFLKFMLRFVLHSLEKWPFAMYVVHFL